MEKLKQILTDLLRNELPNKPQTLQVVCTLLEIPFDPSQTQQKSWVFVAKGQIGQAFFDILYKQHHKDRCIGVVPLLDENLPKFQLYTPLKKLVRLCNQSIIAESGKDDPEFGSCFCLQQKSDVLLKCPVPNCRNVVHNSCIQIFDSSQFYACPTCAMKKIDPLRPVLQQLTRVSKVNNDNKDSGKQEFVLFSNSMTALKDPFSKIIIEIRCLQAKAPYLQHMWPVTGEVYLNNKKILDFPLLLNTLKKRKDFPWQIQNNEDLKIGSNCVIVTSKGPPKNEITHLTGVFVVQQIDAKTLITQVKNENRQSLEDSRQKIRRYFEDYPAGVSKVIVPLTCPLNFQLIQTPVRGVRCKHLQCFSLETFVHAWERSLERQWTCPICKEKAVELVVDACFEDALEKLRLSGREFADVQICRDSSYHLVFSPDTHPVVVIDDELTKEEYTRVKTVEALSYHQNSSQKNITSEQPPSQDFQIININSSQSSHQFGQLNPCCSQSLHHFQCPSAHSCQGGQPQIQEKICLTSLDLFFDPAISIEEDWGHHYTQYNNDEFTYAQQVKRETDLWMQVQELYYQSDGSRSTVIEEELTPPSQAYFSNFNQKKN